LASGAVNAMARPHKVARTSGRPTCRFHLTSPGLP